MLVKAPKQGIAPYFTPEKVYQVVDVEVDDNFKVIAFTIRNDRDHVSYCIPMSCSHIGLQNWEVVKHEIY